MNMVVSEEGSEEKCRSWNCCTMRAAAAAYHYQSGRFSQSLIELQQSHQLWEDERRTLLVPPPHTSHPSEDDIHNNDAEDDDDEIIIATDVDEGNTVGKYENNKRNQWKCGPRHCPTKRVEFIALPLFAQRADVAMIRFRRAVQSSSAQTKEASKSSSSSEPHAVKDSLSNKASRLSSSPSNLLDLWEEAVSSNKIYRRSLLGAAMSLGPACGATLSENGVAEHNLTEIGQQRNRQRTKNDNRIKSSHHNSISRAMKETSLGMLMAGVAASHLHLYCYDGSFRSGHSRSNVDDHISKVDTRSEEDAWSVLVDAAEKAADFMRIRADLTEDDSSNIAGAGKNKEEQLTRSCLEETLRILNETLCKNEKDNEKECDDDNATDGDDELERGNLAMHTFRSALGVAAIATGRLIMPKLKTLSSETMTNNQSHAPKRQRRAEHDAERNDKHNSKIKVVEDEDGSMNFRYSHSSPMMHSRCKFVDALSFHLAAIRHPPRRKLFVNLRDTCFYEAIEWENRAAALYDIGVDGGAGTHVGYAWKVMNCLHGLEVASLPSNPQTCDGTNININECLKEDREKERRVKEALELLPTFSSRFANDWLGCVYASEEGAYVRALDKFQLSLEIAERWSDRPDADEEMAENGCLTEHRTTVNLVLCFLAMGEANAPLELLLHLWMILSETSPDSNTTNKVAMPRARALLISPAGCEFESNNLIPHQRAKLQILWKLFQTSSISQDWSTCLSASEEIMLHRPDKHDESHVKLAHAFALLQCRRTSAAQEITRTLIQELSSPIDEDRKMPVHLLSSSLLLTVAALYHADALLLNEQYNNYHDKSETPSHCTLRAVAAFDAGFRTLMNNVGPNNAPLGELHITTYNDRAISLLLIGDSVGALRYFREAASLSTVVCRGQAQYTQACWLIMPTYFNLSLLLMRDGHVEESAKMWLQLRGHFSVWQQALRGADDALRRLKELHVTAINRHCLLMTKRSMQMDTMMWDQENILEWIPPAEQDEVTEDSSRFGGVDALQITALDALLLKYAYSTAERKSATSFRRMIGRLG